MSQKLLIGLALVSGCALCGCPAIPNHPADLPVHYHNAQYELTFWLPTDWKGYSAVIQHWDGETYLPDKDKDIVSAQGPIIVLRNPLWKTDDLYQDIPVYVFTRWQWDEMHAGKYDAAGAGGIIYELWHNNKYVFAIHSRTFGYNEDLKDWHKTEGIVNQNCAAHPGKHLYPE